MLEQPRSFLSRIFFTEDQSRLRAGWRLLIAFLVTGLFFNIVDWIRHALAMTGPKSGLIGALINFAMVTSAIFFTRYFIDKRSLGSLGLNINKQAALDVLMGIIITFVLMLLVFMIEYSMGWLNFEAFAWQVDAPSAVFSATLSHLLAFIFIGWDEELIFRGYILQTLTNGLNLSWAVLISSLYFGWGHLSNPNSNWMAVTGIFWIGLFFAYAYLRTNQLWLPMGIHIGWNFFENTVFGFPVSGIDHPGLFRIADSGPSLWTGGAFGPEAGLIILPISLLGAMLVHIYTKSRKLQIE